ncbi:endonuclease Q family protein, partial [Candidatus Bipolaricaulota bacterium]|nr:endonuclease Q family protein [Candidatus Bipolaricaulota bacterium]
AMVIPAHVWTPWYAVFGARSGFDSLEACFGEHADRIAALETGLSSDPAMNRRVSAHDRLALVSFSDAHSPEMLGREATLLDLEEYSYARVVDALGGGAGLRGTIEFYPEQGKYHADGHRRCGVMREPQAAGTSDDVCPICGKRLTIGVLHRVLNLADRTATEAEAAIQRPCRHLVPLRQIVAQALGAGGNTKRVAAAYDDVLARCGSELDVMLETPLDVLREQVSERIAQGIDKVRRGELRIEAGHDGIYGSVEIRFDGVSRSGPA